MGKLIFQSVNLEDLTDKHKQTERQTDRQTDRQVLNGICVVLKDGWSLSVCLSSLGITGEDEADFIFLFTASLKDRQKHR